MKLIISEKNSVTKAIAEALGVPYKNREYRNQDYILTNAVGHLVQLRQPDEINPQWKQWSLNNLPIQPFTNQYVLDKSMIKVISATSNQFKIVSEYLKSPQVTSVICATDAGREGEFIFRLITLMVGNKKPVERLWVSSLTKKEIQKGMSQLKPAQEYEGLYQAAIARAMSDYIIGMPGTRAVSIVFKPANHKSALSVGRVKTPVLNKLVEREREIQAFVSKDYFQVAGKFSHQKTVYDGAYVGTLASGAKIYPSKVLSFDTKKEADAIHSAAKQNPHAMILKKEGSPEEKRAPQLFSLSALQVEVSKGYGLSASKTLDATQGLYEKKLVTYPRSSARVISTALIPELPDTLRSMKATASITGWVTDSVIDATQQSITKRNGHFEKSLVDDSQIVDHHAIIPTVEALSSRVWGTLSTDEKVVFEVIYRRFLAAFRENAKFEKTELWTGIPSNQEHHLFYTQEKTVVHAGWMDAEPPKKSAIPLNFSALTPGVNVTIDSLKVDSKHTNPPSRFTDGTIIAWMESPGTFNSLGDVGKSILKKNGIGTEATRASTLEELIKKGYTARQGKALIPTPLGMDLITILEKLPTANFLLSPELTGSFEERMEEIGKAKDPVKARIDFLNDVTKTLQFMVDEIMTQKNQGTVQRATMNTPLDNLDCPVCKKEKLKNQRYTLNCSCGFKLYKEVAHKALTEKQIEALLTKGETGFIKGLKSKTGKSFEAKIKLINGATQFEFKPFASNSPPKKNTGK